MSLPTPSTPLDQRDPTFRRPKLAHYSTPLDTFEPELAQVHRHDKPRRRDHAPSLRAPGRLTPNLNQLETLVDARLYEADPGGLSRLDRCFEVVFYYQPQSPKGGDSTRSSPANPWQGPSLPHWETRRQPRQQRTPFCSDFLWAELGSAQTTCEPNRCASPERWPLEPCLATSPGRHAGGRLARTARSAAGLRPPPTP
jgi:hypothetical protein